LLLDGEFDVLTLLIASLNDLGYSLEEGGEYSVLLQCFLRMN